MNVSSYTLKQIENEVKEFLFAKWLESDLEDYTDAEMQDAYILWHEPLARQYEVVR
jgi:hypothetical protein